MTNDVDGTDPAALGADDQPRRLQDISRGAQRVPGATVTVYPEGPLVLRGSFEVRQVDGTVVGTSRMVALCRCGRSALKPLCDGSHKNPPARGKPSPAGGHCVDG
jgi:CDGSH-type Zn-finger protein